MIDGRWFDTGLPTRFTDLMGCRLSDGKTFFIHRSQKTKEKKIVVVKR